MSTSSTVRHNFSTALSGLAICRFGVAIYLVAAIAISLTVTPESSNAASIGLAPGTGDFGAGDTVLVYKSAATPSLDAANIDGVYAHRVGNRRVLELRVKATHFQPGTTPLALKRGCGRTATEAIERSQPSTSSTISFRLPANSAPAASIYCALDFPRLTINRRTDQMRLRLIRIPRVWIKTSDFSDRVSLKGLPSYVDAVVELGGGIDIFTASGDDGYGDSDTRSSDAQFTVCAGRFLHGSPRDWESLLDLGNCTGNAPTSFPDGSPNPLGVADTLHGGDGDDHLIGDGGNQAIHGHGGSDWLVMGGGDDGGFGGPGEDVIVGQGGDDHLDTDWLDNPWRTEDRSAESYRRHIIKEVSGNDWLIGASGEDTVGYSWSQLPITGTSHRLVLPLPSIPGDAASGGTSVDLIREVERYNLGSGNDEFRTAENYGVTVSASAGDDNIVVSGNASSLFRDTVMCGEPFGNLVSPDNDRVEIDAPRPRRPGEPESFNPQSFLRDQESDCEHVFLQGGVPE